MIKKKFRAVVRASEETSYKIRWEHQRFYFLEWVEVMEVINLLDFYT